MDTPAKVTMREKVVIPRMNSSVSSGMNSAMSKDRSPSRLDSDDYFPADQMVKSSNLVDFPAIPWPVK